MRVFDHALIGYGSARWVYEAERRVSQRPGAGPSPSLTARRTSVGEPNEGVHGMQLTSISLRRPCNNCGHYRFRMEAKRLDHCPVVCARCGHCAGRWGDIRVKGLADTGENVDGLVTRMIGRTLGARRR